MSSQNVDSSSARIYFVLLTFFYIILKQTTVTDKSPKKALIYAISYALLIFIIQYLVNLNLTNQLCNEVQYEAAIQGTFIPWVLIFGVTVSLLFIFPEWISPFANTFGYYFAKLSGGEALISSIFKSQFEKKTGLNNEGQIALENIYSNKSLLINEVNTENYDRFWQKMTEANLLKDSVNSDLKEKFRSVISLKENIGIMVWYLLSGILASYVSYNYILSMSCKRNVNEMKIRYAEYKKKRDKEQIENKKSNIVYKTNEGF